jgi:thioredoxin-like negative regulator of GroEL
MSSIDSGPRASIVASRPRWQWILLLFGAIVLLWGGWAWWADQSYRRAMMAIELEMANGRFGNAARQLRELLEREPDAPEAAILLGRCEQERGRIQAAAEALARVRPGSELSHKAILARMRLRHDQGQFAAAEQLIEDAAHDPRNDAAHVHVLLVPIFSQLGRLDEAQRLLQAWWNRLNERGEGATERAIDQLRMHLELAFRPNPIENVRAYLDQAGRMAPDDDRVWLGRANLAMRTGEYREARRWLDLCMKNRPRDLAVWSARLSLGIATNDVELAHEALARLPADAYRPGEIHRLAAWLCARLGDNNCERRELVRVVAEDPGDPKALERLAHLMELGGQPKRAQDYRRERAEIERLLARYVKLFERNQPIRDAVEMAGLAARLGRSFEARAFLTLAISEEPERDDLRRDLRRLDRTSGRVVKQGQTLAELVNGLSR